MQVGALGIGALARVSPDTPILLARVAFAFENLEVATYELIGRLARRASDEPTSALANRILDQEKAAAELVAGTFDRALELTLGEAAQAPLPGVTPIGKPSERDDSGHHGPQDFKDLSDDEPINEPPAVDAPTSKTERQDRTPPPGYPVGDSEPYAAKRG